MLLLPCFAERVFAGSSYINVFPVKKGCPLAIAACKKMCLGSFDFEREKVNVEGISNTFSTEQCLWWFFLIGHYCKTDNWTSIGFETKMLVVLTYRAIMNESTLTFDRDSLECCVSVQHLILHFTHFEFPANIILWIERKGSGITIILPWSLHNGC